jgi:CHAD domain-containing protein
MRALLRLIRPQFDGDYDSENRLLRDLGRKLSPLRDSAALIQMWDGLGKDGLDGIGKQALHEVRGVLVGQKHQLERVAARKHLASSVAAKIRAYRDRISSWRLDTSGFAALRAGADDVFRAGRKGLQHSEAGPTPEHFHEWRKRAKDHWYLIRLLEDVWPDWMCGQRTSLHTLEQLLGDDHNLFVLEEKLGNEPEFETGRARWKPLRKALNKKHEEFRESAFALGRRVYAEKAAQFTDRLEHMWDFWRSEPKSNLPDEA